MANDLYNESSRKTGFTAEFVRKVIAAKVVVVSLSAGLVADEGAYKLVWSA